MNKILRIDVSGGSPVYKEEEVGKYGGLGGRAMTSAVVNAEVPADCHPLGPENKLVIAPGMLSGSAAVNSGRLSVGCKSPLTCGIKEANSGGQASQILAKLGYAAIILEGERSNDDLYVVRISQDGVKIAKDDSLRMLTNYQLAHKFKDEYIKNGSMISIGTAGEMRMSNSTMAVTDPEGRPTRHAGRGGVGAVMGSKGIKAIVMDGTGAKMLQPKDQEKFKEANKLFTEGLQKNPTTGQGLPAYGTNVLTNVINEAGAYPTYNFKLGRYQDADKISGEAQAELETQRGGNPTHGCHRGCVIRCSGVFVDKDGNYVSKQTEYETVWAHGGNCGICDLDDIARLDFMDDDFGLDTIEMGATIGVAMEAGLLEFGDAKGAIKLVNEVGKGTPLGRILGSGTAATAKAFGLERAPVVKNQALPAYDPRAIQGIGVTYATSTMGADHTAGYAVTANILKVGGDVSPFQAEGQVDLSRDLQIATAALDATGMCQFIAFATLDQPETAQAFIDMINSFHGLQWTAEDMTELGKSILQNERDFNRRAGFTEVHDRLPRYFRREALSPHQVTFDVPNEELDTLYNW
ncbi:MAG: aldehyde ferredoxin oxidoreductase C-terminal domain-containing protein [Desulfohalobiaceae bacterium]